MKQLKISILLMVCICEYAQSAFYLESVLTGLRVDGSGDNVVARKATTNAEQQWEFAKEGNKGYFAVKNAKTGKVLTVEGGCSNLPYNVIAMDRKVGEDGYQLWEQRKDRTIASRCFKGGKNLVLTIDCGSNVIISNGKNTADNKFKVIKA